MIITLGQFDISIVVEQTLVSLHFATLSYQFSLGGLLLGRCLRSSYQILDLVAQLAVAFLNFFLLRTHVNNFGEVRALSHSSIGLLRLSGLFGSTSELTGLVLASLAVTHLRQISLQRLHVALNLGLLRCFLLLPTIGGS